jgi:hypothetical protein
MPQWLAPQPYFLFGAVALVLLTLLAYRRRGRLDAATGLVALFFLAVAVTAVRHQALFFVGVVPFASRTLADLSNKGSQSQSDGLSSLSAFAALVPCCLIVVWTFFPPPEGALRLRQSVFTPGFGIEPGRFPEGAAAYLEAHPESRRLFNTFAHGGYLLWRLYPDRQVFHDGRMELVPEFLGEIGAARANGRDWQALMDRHGVDGAVVRYEKRRLPVFQMGQSGELEPSGYRTVNALLFPRSLYALVYWDDVAMVLLRRTPERSASLEGSEYRHIDPEDLAWTLDQAARDPQFAAAALREAERRLQESPASQVALMLRDELARIRPRLPQSPGATD